MMKKIHFLFFFSFLLFACKESPNEISREIPTSKFTYLDQVNWMETRDSLVITSNGGEIRFAQKELPLQSAMVIPTSVIAYMNELDLLDKISGVSQPDFIFNPKIHPLLKLGTVSEIGTFNELWIEKILTRKPDILISTSSPNLAKFHSQLEKEGIKILFVDEYEESIPLARAEYIKVIGKLFGKEKEANQIFEEVEKNYKEIQTKVQNQSGSKPTVLSNQMYGDIWYLAGGKSYQANLIKDAGGNYLWKNDESSASLQLSFESVFEKAKSADVWVNAGDFASKNALSASFQNYEWFAAFQSGKVYNWNKRMSATGANDFFETGVVRPDWVLKDLAAIFHPELFPGHELVFYKKLE